MIESELVAEARALSDSVHLDQVCFAALSCSCCQSAGKPRLARAAVGHELHERPNNSPVPVSGL